MSKLHRKEGLAYSWFSPGQACESQRLSTKQKCGHMGRYHIHVCSCTCLFVHPFMFSYKHVYVYMYVCMYVCMYVSLYV